MTEQRLDELKKAARKARREYALALRDHRRAKRAARRAAGEKGGAA